MSASLESAIEGLLPGTEKLPDFRGETSWRLEKEKIPEQMALLKAKGWAQDLSAGFSYVKPRQPHHVL